MNTRGGFGLIGILVVIAVIALLFAGRGFFSQSLKQKQSTIQQGVEAEKMAEQVKQQIEQNNKQLK